MKSSYREIRRFKARADDGSISVIVEGMPVIITRDINGMLHTLESPVEYRLDDGSLVNKMDEKTYFVFHTGQLITEIS